jgi:hypothetical protein
MWLPPPARKGFRNHWRQETLLISAAGDSGSYNIGEDKTSVV